MGEAAGAVGRLRSRVWMLMNNPVREGMLASSRLSRERGSSLVASYHSPAESVLQGERPLPSGHRLAVHRRGDRRFDRTRKGGGSGADGPCDAACPTRPELLWFEPARRFSSALAETTLEDVRGKATREAV